MRLYALAYTRISVPPLSSLTADTRRGFDSVLEDADLIPLHERCGPPWVG